jgi:hypothetical protein
MNVRVNKLTQVAGWAKAEKSYTDFKKRVED